MMFSEAGGAERPVPSPQPSAAPYMNDPSGEPTSPPTTTFNILFVCTGNTCRSPLAEGIARRELAERGWRHVEVASAGLAAHAGGTASNNARTIAGRHGICLDEHRTRLLAPEMLEWADLVLAMSPGHMDAVVKMGGEGKVALLGAFAVGDGVPARGIRDPFGGPVQAYENTYRQLRELISASLDRLAPILHP